MAREKSSRPPLALRRFRLVNEQVRETLLNAVRNLPIDTIKPIEIVFREEQIKRGNSQNRLYWAVLNEIAEHAWVGDRQHSAEVWAEYFKRQFLPEQYDPELCLEGYEKWVDLPDGPDRVLVGSSSQLTVRGFANYITQIEAFGASLGVEFSARPA